MSHAKRGWIMNRRQVYFRNELRLRQKKWKIHNKIVMIKEKHSLGSVHHSLRRDTRKNFPRVNQEMTKSRGKNILFFVGWWNFPANLFQRLLQERKKIKLKATRSTRNFVKIVAERLESLRHWIKQTSWMNQLNFIPGKFAFRKTPDQHFFSTFFSCFTNRESYPAIQLQFSTDFLKLLTFSQRRKFPWFSGKLLRQNA